MAEHLLRKMLADRGLNNVKVMSAGVAPGLGLSFPQEAQNALTQEGVPVVQHTPRRLSADLVDQADLILAMEPHHKETVLGFFPGAGDKVHVLKHFAGVGSPDEGIPDPYGQSAAVYARTLEEIKKALEKVVEKLGMTDQF